VETFEKYSCKEVQNDFVEALGYSKERMVVMACDFVDVKDVPANQINRIGRWYKPWFYKHVETFLERGEAVEYIPLRDYFHRHTKSIFWELEQIIPWGNHPIFRFFMGWAVPPKVSFLKLTQTEAIRKLYETQHVIQDMLVPMSRLQEALNVFHDNYNLYPLWLCPYQAIDYSDKQTKHRCFLKAPKEKIKGKNYEMFVDLGAYGIPQDVLDKKPFDIVNVSRKVESYVHSVHGFQMLYADSYLTRDEFRAMFDHSHYDKMKVKYDPDEAFPEVYAKVCKKGLALWKTTNDQKKINFVCHYLIKIPS
jgi:delta24-sterol reductase